MTLRPANSYVDNGYHVNSQDSVHTQGHNGMLWSTRRYEATVAAGADLVLSILTGATYEAHLEFEVDTGGAATVQLVEGSTITGGTALTPRNRNRSLTRAANGSAVTIATLDALCAETVKYGSGISSGGTAIISDTIRAGGTPFTSGAETAEREEWILAPSTQYSIIVTNTEATAKYARIVAKWYEHPRSSDQRPEVLT